MSEPALLRFVREQDHQQGMARLAIGQLDVAARRRLAQGCVALRRAVDRARAAGDCAAEVLFRTRMVHDAARELLPMQIDAFDHDRNEWVNVTTPPSVPRRFNHGFAALDGRLYLVGGNAGFDRNLGQSATTRSVEAFDVASGRWISVASLDQERRQFAIAVLDGKIYLTGGLAGETGRIEADVKVFHPGGRGVGSLPGHWGSVAPLPEPRYWHTCTAHEGKLYVVGGLIWDPNQFGGRATSTMRVYDAASDQWTAGASLSVPRYNHSSVLFEGKMLVIGGHSANRFDEHTYTLSFAELNSVEVYDFALGCWELTASLKQRRSFSRCTVLNGKLYVSAGQHCDMETGRQEAASHVEVLGPTGWTRLATVESKAIKEDEDAEVDRRWESTTCRYLEVSTATLTALAVTAGTKAGE